MTIRVEAIYETGVLRPVEPIPVYDQERVTLTLEPLDASLDHESLVRCQGEQATQRRAPRTIAEIQARWKDIPGFVCRPDYRGTRRPLKGALLL